MYTPDSDSTSFIQGPFGWLIPRCRPSYSYVYLLHFSEPYKHARHYLGSTYDLDARLERHRAGNGARLMEVVTKAGITFEVCRLWRTESYEEARALETRLKKWNNGVRLCPFCKGKPVDVLVAMRQGHWPLHLFASGKRRPMGQVQPVFCRWEGARDASELLPNTWPNPALYISQACK